MWFSLEKIQMTIHGTYKVWEFVDDFRLKCLVVVVRIKSHNETEIKHLVIGLSLNLPSSVDTFTLKSNTKKRTISSKQGFLLIEFLSFFLKSLILILKIQKKTDLNYKNATQKLN